MKIAVVGVGYWGSKLLRNLVAIQGADNVVAVDRNIDQLASNLGLHAVASCLSLEQALSDDSIEAVIVATPVATHTELVAQALEAGRHVLVEKPFTRSTAEAQDLVTLADARNRVLMVGHTFLFSPRVEWISRYLSTQAASRIHYLTSSRLNLGLHRPDANVIWDLGAHDVSIICHLLGEFPTSVSATARGVYRDEHPEIAFMDLTFPSGVIASISVSWLSPLKVRNLVLVTDAGMVVYNDVDPDEPVKVYDKGVVRTESPDFGLNQLTYRYGDTIAPHILVQEPLALELAHFVQCIRTGERPISDGEFGVGIVAALEAADDSWRALGQPMDVTYPSSMVVL